MTYSFYIYYRVDPAKAKVCEPRIKELFAAVRKATGVSGKLMRKRGESNLWMEIYLDVTDAAAGVTCRMTVVVRLDRPASTASYVNRSVPVKSSSGVYVNPPSVLKVNWPCTGALPAIRLAVTGPPEPTSLASTPVAAVATKSVLQSIR